MIMNSAKLLSRHALQKKKPSRAWLYASRAFSAQDSAELEVEIEVDQRKLPADYDPATFDPTEHRSPPTERVFRLVDEVANLTLMEVSELSAIIMAKMRLKQLPKVVALRPGALAAAVSAAGAPRPAAANPAAAAASAPAKEKTAFELRLEGFDAAAKIKVIKEVRAFTELGLKEAKDLVEKLPAVIKRGLTKEEGEALAEKLKAVGAKVVLD